MSLPHQTEIQNESKLGNQRQGAKTLGRNKWETLRGLVSKPNIPGKEYPALQLQQRIQNTEEVYGWLVS